VFKVEINGLNHISCVTLNIHVQFG